MSGPPSSSPLPPTHDMTSANQPSTQPPNQPINQQTNPPINQPVNQPMMQPPASSTNQPVNPAANPAANQTINAVPRLDARLIYSILRTADEQRQKPLRHQELQQFLTLIKADTEGKLVTSAMQSDKAQVPIDSLASFTRPPNRAAPMSMQIAPSNPAPPLTPASSQDSSSSKKKSKKTKDGKDKSDKKKDKDKKSNKKKSRDSDSDSSSDSDRDKKKKDKKKKSKDDDSNKRQRVSSPEPTGGNSIQAMEEGAAAARIATAELASSAGLAQGKLVTFDNDLHELQAATAAKLASLSNSDEHRKLNEQAALQAKERQAAKETLDKIKKQMLQKEQVLSALRTQREQLERHERAIMTDKLKQSEYFLQLPTVHARFTWAANNSSLHPDPLAPSNSSTSPPYKTPSPITPPEERMKLADERALQLACLACQTHLRSFIDSMMRVKRKRLEEPVKRAIEQSKTIQLQQSNEDMVEKIHKIETDKELYWEKQAALREARMKGVDVAEAERAFDLAHQNHASSSSSASLLKKRGTEPHLITVLDFAFALENDRLVNQSNAHAGRLASVWARLPHRIKEWPPSFQPPHPITRTAPVPMLTRPPQQHVPNQYVPNQYVPNQYVYNQYASNQYAPNQHAPNQYASSNFNMGHPPHFNRPSLPSQHSSSHASLPSQHSSSNASPASTAQSDDLEALMDLEG